MDQVVQSNAANAEENASAATELNLQTQNLEQVIKELSKVIHGN